MGALLLGLYAPNCRWALLNCQLKTAPNRVPHPLTKEMGQTNPYRVVIDLYRLDRVGALRLPTLLYQQTNLYGVVYRKRHLSLFLTTSLLDTYYTSLYFLLLLSLLLTTSPLTTYYFLPYYLSPLPLLLTTPLLTTYSPSPYFSKAKKTMCES